MHPVGLVATAIHLTCGPERTRLAAAATFQPSQPIDPLAGAVHREMPATGRGSVKALGPGLANTYTSQPLSQLS